MQKTFSLNYFKIIIINKIKIIEDGRLSKSDMHEITGGITCDKMYEYTTNCATQFTSCGRGYSDGHLDFGLVIQNQKCHQLIS